MRFRIWAIVTETELLRRCCESPDDHLAERRLTQFEAYTLGYRAHSAIEAEDFDDDAFTCAVKRDFRVGGSWPCNVATTGFLVAAEGEERALSKYLDYRARLSKPTGERDEPYSATGLFEKLASKDAHSLRKTPQLYFGNEPAVSHILSMISGCRWAEIDANCAPGKASAFQVLFQSWIEERFPFSRGIPWHRTLHFVSLHSSEGSLRTFFEYFDLFQSGERPESLSQSARLMLKSIAARCGCDPADLEDTIRRIAPI